jgi:hypothetical protein
LSLNDHLDKIEKQTVEEMLSAEQNLQVELKKVLVAIETKRTDFEYIKVLIRSRISKKDRQYNGKRKRTNNDLLITT